MAKTLKRGKYESKTNVGLRRGAPNRDVSNAPKVNHEGGCGSQIDKTT